MNNNLPFTARLRKIADRLEASDRMVEAAELHAAAEAIETKAFALYQARVVDWMCACFPASVLTDPVERADRLVEEVLELAQTVPGYSADRAQALVDYVWARPVGEPSQEVGGVIVCLAALCHSAGIDMVEAGEAELARVWRKIDVIRAKHAAKPTGSALPGPSTPTNPARDALVASAHENRRLLDLAERGAHLTREEVRAAVEATDAALRAAGAG